MHSFQLLKVDANEAQRWTYGQKLTWRMICESLGKQFFGLGERGWVKGKRNA